jgi:hypothetical protein
VSVGRGEPDLTYDLFDLHDTLGFQDDTVCAGVEGLPEQLGVALSGKDDDGGVEDCRSQQVDGIYAVHIGKMEVDE